MPLLQPAQPSEMEDATRGSQRLLEEPIPQSSKKRAFHADHATIAIPGPGVEKARLDKQSVGYILRSGLAGGLAGCAVKHTNILATELALI